MRASLAVKLRIKLEKQQLCLEQVKQTVHYWRIYPRTDRFGCLDNVQLTSCKSESSPAIEQRNIIEVRGVVKTAPILPNQAPPENNKFLKLFVMPNNDGTKKYKKPFNIVITGDSIPAAKGGEFWKVVANVVDGQLIYHSGECIEKEYDPNITYTPPGKEAQDKSGDSIDPNSAEKSKGDAKAIDTNSEPQGISNKSTQEGSEKIVPSSEPSVVTGAAEKTLTAATTANQDNSQPPSSDIIMINGRAPELTVKFSTRPELPETGKKVTLQINSDNGISVRATLNRKTLKKQVDKMDSFDEWVGALSGQMSGIAEDGVIDLEGAGLQVFEKKKKPVESEKQESEKSVTEKKEESVTPSKN
ncbi:MAG: hypothetical protein QNJ54_35160 [Prochloraceae cyanobacterium]|nr:hypothetical protein [Prochloraceae cyanobacterium]